MCDSAAMLHFLVNDNVNSMNVHDADSINCCVTNFTETVNKLANLFF